MLNYWVIIIVKIKQYYEWCKNNYYAISTAFYIIIKLKELEMQISQYDIAIEQEKLKNYSLLYEELIRDYFKKIICGDINNYEVRKQIIKTFVREVILYNDAIVIFYNFTNLAYAKGIAQDDINNFDLEKAKAKLITEKDINKVMDITIFYSKNETK